MVFLIPLNEVQIYSRRYAQKLAYDGVMKESFNFFAIDMGSWLHQRFGVECYNLSSATDYESLAESLEVRF